jgi:hypothetical protein
VPFIISYFFSRSNAFSSIPYAVENNFSGSGFLLIVEAGSDLLWK